MFGIRHLPIRANQSQRIWKIQYRRFPLCIKDSQRPDRHFTKIRFDTKSFTFDWEHFFLFWTWHQHISGFHVGKLNNASPMRIFNELLSFCQSSINQVLAKKKLPRWSLFQLVLWWQRYDTTMKNNKQQHSIVEQINIANKYVCVATSRPFNFYECGDKSFSYLDVKYADIKMVVSLQDLNVQTFRSILSWKLNVEMFLRLQIFVCSNLTSCCILSLITMFRCSGVWLQTFKCSNEKSHS